MCVLAHPKASSFNGAILNRIRDELEKKGHEVDIWDLYALGFNPVLPLSEIQRGFSIDPLVQRASESLRKADAYLFIHPVWWGGMPAILKGFVDRVFRSGVAFDFIKNGTGELEKHMPFQGKKALVIMTTDSETDFISSHELLWTEGIGVFCGMDFHFRTFWNLFFSTYERRKSFLDSLPSALEEIL
jgi:putative NADPH-quinone reductase